jgi:biopolymer transport protein ExbB
MQDTTLSLLDLFRMGGAFMWPLLIFSIATTAIAAERIVFLARHNLSLSDLRVSVSPFTANKDAQGAIARLEIFPRSKMGARILLALMRRAGMSEHFMEKAAETEALGCIGELENGLNYLTVLGSIAPLTGFLGTVSGMIGAFKSIAEATEVNAQIVANGIYEALITTVFGLIIAIVAMTAHSILSSIVDNFASNVEKMCSEVIIEMASSPAV